jgi:hypothetical protein
MAGLAGNTDFAVGAVESVLPRKPILRHKQR